MSTNNVNSALKNLSSMGLENFVPDSSFAEGLRKIQREIPPASNCESNVLNAALAEGIRHIKENFNSSPPLPSLLTEESVLPPQIEDQKRREVKELKKKNDQLHHLLQHNRVKNTDTILRMDAAHTAQSRKIIDESRDMTTSLIEQFAKSQRELIERHKASIDRISEQHKAHLATLQKKHDLEMQIQEAEIADLRLQIEEQDLIIAKLRLQNERAE